MQAAASFVVKMTATPKDLDNLVEITEDDLKKDEKQLLKTTPELNYLLENLEPETINEWDLLTHVLKTFKTKIRPQYQKLSAQIGHTINPAILIQVDSKTTKNDAYFEDNIAKIIKTITTFNLSYVKYFGSEKTSNLREKIDLLQISQNNSTIDVIIFKIGPATGWDIPRACVLLQLRNVCSLTLNAQTIGRIKRNPLPNLTKNNPVIDNYYLYSNHKVKFPEKWHYQLQQKYIDLTWATGKVSNYDQQLQLEKEAYCQQTKRNFDEWKENVLHEYQEAQKEEEYLITQEDKFETKYSPKFIHSRQHKLRNQLELTKYIKNKTTTTLRNAATDSRHHWAMCHRLKN